MNLASKIQAVRSGGNIKVGKQNLYVGPRFKGCPRLCYALGLDDVEPSLAKAISYTCADPWLIFHQQHSRLRGITTTCHWPILLCSSGKCDPPTLAMGTQPLKKSVTRVPEESFK